MFYKNIIFDLDNTLYDYNVCHTYALKKIFEYLLTFNKELDINYLYESYNIIDNIHKNQTNNTASSHNKFIKIKQLLEMLNIPICKTIEIHDLYWNAFYLKIKPYDDILDFIKWNKKIGIKIGILTDYETEYQVEKLKKIGILEFIDCLITSEEVGCEKPNQSAFNFILKRMNANRNYTLMFGDSYKKDIEGGLNSNLYCCWLNKEFKIGDKLIEFNYFHQIYKLFNDIFIELKNLQDISKFCGERFDLVQAGGGNSSIKVNDIMIIKASGGNLSDITTDKGYVLLNNHTLNIDINKNVFNKITNYRMIGESRPSIETSMHSILKKYVIHLHPIQVNRILVSKNAKSIIKSLFKDALVLDYFTPGIKICQEIKNNYKNEELIFLINHGIIITTNKYDNIKLLLDQVINVCENYEQIDMSMFKKTNVISKYISDKYKIYNVSYLSQDSILNKYLLEKKELFEINITFPDALIYCGYKIFFCDNINKIDDYYKIYNETPKIIILNSSIYINSVSINKCRDIESVLKANLIILDTTYEKQCLSRDEIFFLNNWEAEKYRKKI